MGSSSRWQIVVIIGLVLAVIGLAVAVIVMATRNTDRDDSVPVCGGESSSRGNGHSLIDLTDPEVPGPFHDLTMAEIEALHRFLQRDPNISAVKPQDMRVDGSYVFMMDLFLPQKSDVLRFLDEKAEQPQRNARVIVFRGDLDPPAVHEYICGPLPDVSNCSLLMSKSRRNPLEFSLRPSNHPEFFILFVYILPYIDKEIGYILEESFGAVLQTDCEHSTCFSLYFSPVSSNLLGDLTKRKLWVWASYDVEYSTLHPVDFAVLLDLSGSNPENFRVTNIWYNGQFFNDMDELIIGYNNSRIDKIRLRPPADNKNLFSSLHQRGSPLPEKPQRPPTLVEPDGKRYTLKGKRVEYLGWSFHFRMSPLTGPSLYDIQYKGERIAYELGLAEIAVFYSADNPMQLDYLDSAILLGIHAKAMVPGGDCPETATLINQTIPAQTEAQGLEMKTAFCLFENNNGMPLWRHLSYKNYDGGFYAGMLDSALVLRSALSIGNYDYVIDFTFHQNGVMETKAISTGYILSSAYRPEERPYGFRIQDNVIGNLHHHLFHFKVDLDIGGTSNRYETLDIKKINKTLRTEPMKSYYQTTFEHNRKNTEKEALYKFDFDQPKYHVIHNNATRTKYGEIKAYRMSLHGMSKQVLPENLGNEASVPWARYQLAVTRHNDDEVVSSTPYAMYDSMKPVTDFTTFFEDDESIVDEDLVFWVTQGMHHIPHTEDLPVTATTGTQLAFVLSPFNYFEECPSMASRDQVRIEYKNHLQPAQGVSMERNGYSDKTCSAPEVIAAYRKRLEDDPDVALESQKEIGVF